MKKPLKRRLLALLLAVMVLGSFLAGCSSSTDDSSDSSAGSNSDGSADAADSSGNGEEPYTVVVCIPNGTSKSLADEAEIEAAINEITVEEINCKIDLQFISFGQYSDQINLMLAAGEDLDLFFGFGGIMDVSYMASTGQLEPIEAYLEEYGQGVIDALGNFYSAGLSTDGHVYWVADIRDMVYSNGLSMRKDVLDAAGIDINDIQSLEDIGEMCAKIQETGAWDGSILTYLDNLYYYDGLGNDLGAIMDLENSLTVSNLYESDEFAEVAYTARDWYEKGYIYPEAPTTTDNAQTLCKNGLIAGYVLTNKPGQAAEQTVNTGYEMVSVTWGDTIGTTSDVNGCTWQVASNTEDVVSAVKMLNLMYSDERIANLINFGIEGEHYVVNDEGFATYPEGVDDNTTGWTFNTAWMLGNEYLTYVWEGNDIDLWEQTKAFNDSATLSLSFGFTPNMDNVSTQVAACQAVVDQYYNALITGCLELPSALDEFNEKLYSSGLQDIIDEKQAQLDEWAAANGVTAND